MAINFFSEDRNPPAFLRKKTKKWISDTITSRGFLIGEINYIFCSDDLIIEINNQYLNHDYYTDIITFDYTDLKTVNADIYISIDRIKENSKIFKEKYLHEFYRVLIHGILHLTGQNDKTKQETKKMRDLENYYLSKIFNNRV